MLKRRRGNLSSVFCWRVEWGKDEGGTNGGERGVEHSRVPEVPEIHEGHDDPHVEGEAEKVGSLRKEGGVERSGSSDHGPVEGLSPRKSARGSTQAQGEDPLTPHSIPNPS